MKLRLIVEGMSCIHCSSAVKQTVSQLYGVENVEIKLHEKEVLITGEDLDENEIKEAIEDLSYNVTGCRVI